MSAHNKIWKFLVLVAIMLSSLNSACGEKMKEEDIIVLPLPDTKGKVPLETTILKRRSIRSFTDQTLNLAEIGQLLWAAQGITDRKGLRAAPSAGALYPLEIYVVKEDGFFHYLPEGHKLRRLSERDLRRPLQSAALSQSWVGEAAVDIIICAVYERVTSGYGKRGIRYTDIEVGHAAQNIHLQAVALGLGSVPIGAFSDDGVARVLSLPDEEIPLYIIPVGYRK